MMDNQLQDSQIKVTADDMVSIAKRNLTSQALLKYFATMTDLNHEMMIPGIIKDLTSRGVGVNESDLMDTLQDLESYGLGVIVEAKLNVAGDIDRFKPNYNLASVAGRAFPRDVINQAIIDINVGNHVHLVTPNDQFTIPEESNITTPVKRRGRPFGYSHKKGAYLTQSELAEREYKKMHKNPHAGRPKGSPNVSPSIKAMLKSERLKNPLSKKGGRPKGYSLKLKRFLTTEEQALKDKGLLDFGKLIEIEKRYSYKTPKNAPLKPAATMSPASTRTISSSGRTLTVPVNGKDVSVTLPPGFNLEDLTTLTGMLTFLINNS